MKMPNDRSASGIIRALKPYRSFVLTTHVHADPDAIGSVLAMGVLVRRLGKRAVMIVADPLAEQVRFLPASGRIVQYRGSRRLARPDAVIVLDSPTLGRTGELSRRIAAWRVPVINIDHHISNQRFGAVNWVRPKASSCGELVYELFGAAGLALGRAEATCLYVAIATDTGGFRYENTTRYTHQIAADLLGRGVRPAVVHRYLGARFTPSVMQMLGAVLRQADCSVPGAVVLSIPHRMLVRYRAGILDSEDFLAPARAVRGSEVTVLLREPEKGRVQVSLRSQRFVDVNRIAGRFGGGGHRRAAGCTLKTTLPLARERILTEVRHALAARS